MVDRVEVSQRLSVTRLYISVGFPDLWLVGTRPRPSCHSWRLPAKCHLEEITPLRALIRGGSHRWYDETVSHFNPLR